MLEVFFLLGNICGLIITLDWWRIVLLDRESWFGHAD